MTAESERKEGEDALREAAGLISAQEATGFRHGQAQAGRLRMETEIKICPGELDDHRQHATVQGVAKAYCATCTKLSRIITVAGFLSAAVLWLQTPARAAADWTQFTLICSGTGRLSSNDTFTPKNFKAVYLVNPKHKWLRNKAEDSLYKITSATESLIMAKRAFPTQKLYETIIINRITGVISLTNRTADGEYFGIGECKLPK